MISIKLKLIAAIGVPLLIAFLVMAWCEYHVGRREVLAAMESHLTELVVGESADLDGDLRAAEELARTMALFVETSPSMDADRLQALLRDCLRVNPDVFGMCLAFEKPFSPSQNTLFAPYYCRDKTDLRFVDIAQAFPDYAEKNWYLPAKQTGRPFWTEPYFDTGVGERIMCTYTVPLMSEETFHGVATVDLLSETLLADIASRKIGSGYCVLISQKGTFISHPDAKLLMKESIFSLARRKGLDELADAGEQMVAGKAGMRRIRDYGTGEPKWMVFAPVKSTGWSLAAIIPEKEVMASVYARLIRLLGLLGAGLAVIFGIVVLVSVRITRPIRCVAQAAESIGQGNLGVRIEKISGRDEVACLARTFNTMAGDLQDNIQRRIREEVSRKEVEGELKAARNIQASLLPAALVPKSEDEFSLHAINLPAKVVAGDFYDFFFLDGRRLAVVIADVSGKGIPAAMYMAVTRTKLRDFASPEKTPAEVLAAVNRSLAQDNEREMFVSIFLGYYDIKTGELDYANGGHNPPYLIGQNGQLKTLEPTGPLVAVFPEANFETARCILDSGDSLVLFTDGITEADRDGILFGEKRLEQQLQTSRESRPEELCHNIIESAVGFCGGDLPDDATVLVLKRNEAS